MIHSFRHRMSAIALAGIAAVAIAGPAAAVTPTVETRIDHVVVSWFDCGGFTVLAEWDIAHKITYYYDSDGVAIRDIERVDFTGRLSNPVSGAWVTDWGTRIFFDTLAPDGSFLATTMVTVRKSAYLHDAGRVDFQTGVAHGRFYGDADVAALCEALGA